MATKIKSYKEYIIKQFYKIYKEEYDFLCKVTNSFVEDHQRILCGEYAIVTFLRDAGINVSKIYEVEPKITFYSNDSISDTRTLLNKYDTEAKGLKTIVNYYSRKDTKYNIVISNNIFDRFVTIRYVPFGYDKIDTITLDKKRITSPIVMRTFILHCLTDPLVCNESWIRFTKYLICLDHLEPLKVGPFPISRPMDVPEYTPHEDVLLGNIIVGKMAYNKATGSNIPIDYVEMLSFNTKDIIGKIKSGRSNGESKNNRYDIEIFHNDFYRNKVTFSKQGKIFLVVYSIENQCVPTLEVDGLTFGLFHVILLYMYLEYERYKGIIKNFIKERNKFLKEKKLIGIEDTCGLYKIFDTACLGNRVTEGREYRIGILEGKEKDFILKKNVKANEEE
jgi:hypothetical protein